MIFNGARLTSKNIARFGKHRMFSLKHGMPSGSGRFMASAIGSSSMFFEGRLMFSGDIHYFPIHIQDILRVVIQYKVIFNES